MRSFQNVNERGVAFKQRHKYIYILREPSPKESHFFLGMGGLYFCVLSGFFAFFSTPIYIRHSCHYYSGIHAPERSPVHHICTKKIVQTYTL